MRCAGFLQAGSSSLVPFVPAFPPPAASFSGTPSKDRYALLKYQDGKFTYHPCGFLQFKPDVQYSTLSSDDAEQLIKERGDKFAKRLSRFPAERADREAGQDLAEDEVLHLHTLSLMLR